MYMYVQIQYNRLRGWSVSIFCWCLLLSNKDHESALSSIDYIYPWPPQEKFVTCLSKCCNTRTPHTNSRAFIFSFYLIWFHILGAWLHLYFKAKFSPFESLKDIHPVRNVETFWVDVMTSCFWVITRTCILICISIPHYSLSQFYELVKDPQIFCVTLYLLTWCRAFYDLHLHLSRVYILECRHLCRQRSCSRN